MHVGQAIVHILVAEGVRVAAGINGLGTIPDSLASAEGMRFAYTRQERVAADILDGYGRVSGGPGVLTAADGPGVANCLAGIANSYSDSTPLLFLASQVNRFQATRRGPKELAIHDIYQPVSKWTTEIIDPSQTVHIMQRAFVALRSGRPGPVVVEVPYDVSRMQVPEFSYRPPARIRSSGDPQSADAAVRALATAERPYVCVGAGVLFSEATPELVELAELLTLPVATTLNGKSAFPEDHRLSLGMGGITVAGYATIQAIQFAQQADVVLTIGCNFNKHQLEVPMREDATLIQVDVDVSELHKETRADIAILGDAKLVLRQMVDHARDLLPQSRLQPRPKTVAQIDKLRQEWMAVSMPHLTSSERPINPFRVTWELTQLLDPNQTIVTHDAGSVRGSTSQHYIATVPRSFLGYGNASCMGWSLGAAMGAKLASPEKMAVAVMGDEAFGETGFDLETATCSDIPILVVVINNHAGRGEEGEAISKLTELRFKVGQETGDYSALARALGFQAERVEDPEAVRPTLGKAIDHVRGGGRALVEVITKRVPVTLHSASRRSAGHAATSGDG